MLGAIIGDIVGSRFEFNNHRSKEFELFGDGCFATDDSIMTLAVAKAILETEKSIERGAGLFDSDQSFFSLLSKLTIKHMREIGRKYPDCGYGGMFGRWIFSDDPQPYNSFGNGAAMRVSPVGFYARNEYEIAELSRAVTAVTHDHVEGLKGAEATALAICLARSGKLKEEIKDVLERDYYRLDFTIDEIKDAYRFNETCQETVPQAIQCFLESESFEDAIRIAISLGGDSDTIAAITGAIAEAYYGVPEPIKQQAFSYLDDELLGIYKEWEDRASINDNGQFWTLTKYIGRFTNSDPYGQWIVDTKGDGSPDNPYYFPWVDYRLPVESFIRETNEFSLNHPEFRPYMEVLESHKIKWDHEVMCHLNVDKLDEECLIALIVASVRAEKFCDGAVLHFLEEGCIQKWLKKLRDFDHNKVKNRKLAELHFSIGGFGIPERYRLIFAEKRSYYLSKEKTNEFKAFSELETKALRDAWDELHIEYWRYQYPQEGDNIICDGTQWSLDVCYEKGFWVTYHGDNRYPENWFELLKLFGIDESDNDNDDENEGETNQDGNRRLTDKVTYCEVSLSKHGAAYSYLTEDRNISVGDMVIVPVGENNIERSGRVETVEHYFPEDVPYPLDKIKKIIRRVK
jgi:ADP-ribosyl-[dinitrogen reductase] hydrolase